MKSACTFTTVYFYNEVKEDFFLRAPTFINVLYARRNPLSRWNVFVFFIRFKRAIICHEKCVGTENMTGELADITNLVFFRIFVVLLRTTALQRLITNDYWTLVVEIVIRTSVNRKLVNVRQFSSVPRSSVSESFEPPE